MKIALYESNVINTGLYPTGFRLVNNLTWFILRITSVGYNWGGRKLSGKGLKEIRELN